jgi:hypothetical protein
MRALLLVTLTCRLALAAHDTAPTEVPKSRSPDGTFALYYEPFPNRLAGSPEVAISFSRNGTARASAQLSPDFGNNYPGKPGIVWGPDKEDAWDTQALLDMICRSHEFHLRGERFDSGFSYNVTWTLDSRWVVVEGGAHKFWHMVVYHFAGGQFRQVDLATLSSQIESYVAAQAAAPKFQELGIQKALDAKWGAGHEEQYVIWLDDGRLAVLGYPFLLSNANFGRLEEKGATYFLVDSLNPLHAKVTGMAH